MKTIKHRGTEYDVIDIWHHSDRPEMGIITATNDSFLLQFSFTYFESSGNLDVEVGKVHMLYNVKKSLKEREQYA